MLCTVIAVIRLRPLLYVLST